MIGLKILIQIKQYLGDNSCLTLIRLLNFCPGIGGFPLQTDTIKAPFMILNISLQFYAFIVGTVAYLMYIADGFFESIVSFFNVQIFAVAINNTLWFLFKKKDLNELLTLVLENDSLIISSGRYVHEYRKLLGKIKVVIIICHLFHFINDILIYLPSRIFYMELFSVVSCVGLDLTSSPSHELCMLLLAGQEVTAAVVVVAFDSIVLFMFSHTTAIFYILYKDMESFTEITDNLNKSEEMFTIASRRIKNIVERHTVALRTVAKMQTIYALAIGCSFSQNAISMCLFFVLPIEISLNFAPLIFYSLFVYFLYCYFGQKLTNASLQFEKAVLGCGWYNLPIKEQKSILLILKQAQKPVVLKAGDIVPISIYTFACVLQNIYKFVTVFKL